MKSASPTQSLRELADFPGSWDSCRIPFSMAMRSPIMDAMERPTFQMTLGAMLGVVACIALNFWLFRLGVLWGILGLNVTKHVVIAYLCQVLGVDRRVPVEAPTVVPNRTPQVPVS
jgi:hypothetical protein